MQISEYSFYRLYQEREAELARELEYRRVAEERMAEEGAAGARVSVFRRVMRGLGGLGHASEAPARLNRLRSSQ